MIRPDESAPATAPLPTSLPAEADAELLPDFIAESVEYMERAEAALLALEEDPSDLESVNVVFRAFHTIKGTSAFLGFAEISRLAHHAEELFDRFRKGEMTCAGAAADLSLRCVDTLSEMLHAIERAAAGGSLVYPECFADVLAALVSTAAGTERPAGSPPRLGDLLVQEGKVDRATVEAAIAARPDKPLGEALVAIGAVTLADVDAALRKQKHASGGEAAEGTVRVRMERLDRLVDLVGELVVAHALIAHDPVVARAAHPELARRVARTSALVRELQELSVSMRMVPLRPLFQKMQRLVRDVARKSGKFVEFVTVGEATEIDRNVADLIADPLVHMVRNAVGHGIESPEERERAGKRRTGTVRLSAYHADGSVVVELSDDGRGLDRERILARAAERGIVDAGRGLSDREVFDLVFAPGFSTAEVVTDLSGRGVGMDVVRRNVEAIRGRVEIDSQPGVGSTFSLRLPLTLAMTDGALVRVGEREREKQAVAC